MDPLGDPKQKLAELRRKKSEGTLHPSEQAMLDNLEMLHGEKE